MHMVNCMHLGVALRVDDEQELGAGHSLAVESGLVVESPQAGLAAQVVMQTFRTARDGQPFLVVHCNLATDIQAAVDQEESQAVRLEPYVVHYTDMNKARKLAQLPSYGLGMLLCVSSLHLTRHQEHATIGLWFRPF